MTEDEQANTSEGDGKNTELPNTTGDTTSPKPGEIENDKAVFTQADLNRIIQKTRAEEKEKAEKRSKQEKEEAERAKLAESGEFKLLHEQALARVKELETAHENERITGLKIRIATKLNLPDTLIDRLIGTTEAEITADAKELLKTVAPPKAAAHENATQADVQSVNDASKQAMIDSGRYQGL